MKPAAFAYHRPATLHEATALLARHGDDARLLAGGQSLVPMMNLRLVRPGHLVDLAAVANLAGIDDRGGSVAIGALATHHAVARSAAVARRAPLLALAAGTIGHYAIRQRGTLGGSLAHADPAAQLPLVAVALGARIELTGPGGARTIPATLFFTSLMTTALAPGEVLTSVEFPAQRPDEGWGFALFARRHGDFALAIAAARLVLADGRIERCSVVVGAVTAVPRHFDAAELGIEAMGADAGVAARAAQYVGAAIDPDDSPAAPAEFRREITAAMVRRAIDEAIGRLR